MGLGKTSATLTALDILYIADVVSVDRPALILAPLRVARNTWPEELAKWDHLRDLRLVPVVGSAAERAEALRTPAELYTMNYENIPWLIQELQRQKKVWPFRTIVADESTKLKSFRLRQGGKRARELARVAHTHADRFIQLTGTPSPNGLTDLWGQVWFLDGGKRLGSSFTAYTQRWFQKGYDGFSVNPLPFAQEQIEDRLRDICISLNAADYFDIEKPIVTVLDFDLSKDVRALYREMEQRAYMELERHGVEAVNAADKMNKCLQTANGAVYVDGTRNWKQVHDEKLDILEDVIEEACGMPVLVAYHFRPDLERLKKRFPHGADLSVEKNLKAFKNGDVPVGFAHPASMGHGIDGLQNVTNILVFFSITWNLEEHDQIIERIGPVRQMQAGFERPVFIYYIMARDTVEQLVKLRLESKRSTQDILMEALRKYREPVA